MKSLNVVNDVLSKSSDMHYVGCHGNSCVYGLHISFKTGYLISNFFVNTGCAYVEQFDTLPLKCIRIEHILEGA